jgi:hypothetical protein
MGKLIKVISRTFTSLPNPQQQFRSGSGLVASQNQILPLQIIHSFERFKEFLNWLQSA